LESRANETLGGLNVEAQESDESDESDEEVLFVALPERWFCCDGTESVICSFGWVIFVVGAVQEAGVKVVLTANSYTNGGFSRRRFSRGEHPLSFAAQTLCVMIVLNFVRTLVDAGANKIQASATAVASATAAAGGAGVTAPAAAEAAPLSEAEMKLREELNALRVRVICLYPVTQHTRMA
jgi:hypothetical protein